MSTVVGVFFEKKNCFELEQKCQMILKAEDEETRLYTAGTKGRLKKSPIEQLIAGWLFDIIDSRRERTLANMPTVLRRVDRRTSDLAANARHRTPERLGDKRRTQ